MRKLALVLVTLGAGLTLAGTFLRLTAWNGQEAARVRWEEEAAGDVPRKIGDPALTRLSFPMQGTEFFVQKGATKENLLRGPVWVTWSGSPGEKGNCIIAAHRDTHFHVLKDVKKGERLIVERSGRRYVYRIATLTVVNATDNNYYLPTSKPVLTLVTCYPFSYVGRAPKRFIVRAVLQEANS